MLSSNSRNPAGIGAFDGRLHEAALENRGEIGMRVLMVLPALAVAAVLTAGAASAKSSYDTSGSASCEQVRDDALNNLARAQLQSRDDYKVRKEITSAYNGCKAGVDMSWLGVDRRVSSAV
jgi:hypothetical protein